MSTRILTPQPRLDLDVEAGWRTAVKAPVRVALAPLASVLAVVDLTVRRPSLVLAAAVLLVCLPPQLSNLGASVTAPDLVAMGAVALVALRLIAGDRAHGRSGWLPYALVVGSLAIATITATDVGASVKGFLRYSELFVLIPVAAAMAVKDRFDLYLVAGSLVTMTMVEGGVGVYQYLTNTGASYAGQYVRAVGTFGAEQVLAMGAVVGYGLLVTLALGLAMRGKARIALLAASAFLVLPLYLSLSRGSWIATALAVGVMMFVYSWRWTAALTATAIFAVAVLSFTAGPAGSPFGERLTSIVSSSSEPDRSVRDRYALWTAAVGMWADHPIVGVGLKDFAGYRDTYAPMSLSAGSDVDDPSQGFRREPLLSAHNQYLMVLAEQGTVGILAFGGLLGTLLVGALRRRPRDLPAPVHPRFFDLLAPGVMAWTLIDFTYGDIGAGPTGVILAILLGLVARRMVLVPRPEVTS